MDFLNSVGLSIVAFVFVLGVLIFIHELGHYLVAKALGIRVEVFSLGFGTRLLGFRRGDTDYRISLIPLGGYVKMTGENPDEALSGSPEEFLSRPKLHRLAVVLAGPLMNLGLAVGLLSINFMAGTEVMAYLDNEPVIGAVQIDSPAERAGLELGDKIWKIDGEAMPAWSDVEFKIRTSPEILLVLEVERNGQRMRREVVAEASPGTGAGYIGIAPYLPYRVSAVEPGSAAEEAGLKPGDLIHSVTTPAGKFSGFYMIAEGVSSAGEQPLVFEIERAGEITEKTITPRMLEDRPRIGAYVDFETVTRQYGPLSAIQQSVAENIRWTKLTFATVGRILTGDASMKQISGPIEIARFSGRAASMGWMALLGFMALVSLQLGILNLLPIPILDGGVIALLAVETVLGRDLSTRVKERIYQVGFIFLVVLMGVVLFNDLTKNLGGF